MNEHEGLVYLGAAVAAFVLAQGIKFVLNLQSKQLRNKGWRQLIESGSMPSSHSAVVIAFASSIFFVEGASKLFAVAAVLALITVYDSLVVRRSSGEQGRALLRLLSISAYAKDPLPYVAIGHRPLEVVAGGALGVAIGYSVAVFIT